ncbi:MULTISPECIES: S1 family peptidase [Acetobacterales]|uniref:S1 family peptidase n=1 Tax=Roseomonas sp. WGS1072 TaxID=3366816 RepID=UPI003BF441C0
MRAWLRWCLPGGGLAMLGIGLACAASGRAAAPEATPSVPTRFGGSAFLIGPGRMVTNTHVVLRCRLEGRGVAVEGLPGPWRVLAEDPGTDLALLAGPAAGEAALALSAAPRLPRGLPVLVLGYPANQPGHRPQASAGTLRHATLTVHDPEGGHAVSFVMTDRQGREVEPGWEDGLRYFGAAQAERLRWRLEIAAPASGGSSGGPVLDAAGNVVGVVYAGGAGGTSAVPLTDLRDFLARSGVAPRLQAPAGGGTPDWRAVQERVADAIRRVTC